MSAAALEEGLRAEIEAARTDTMRALELDPQMTRTFMKVARERVVEAFPGRSPGERIFLVHLIAALTLSLEAEEADRG